MSEPDRTPRRAEPDRRDPRLRPSDPAGTRPKFDPESLLPAGDFRALPAGEPPSQRGENVGAGAGGALEPRGYAPVPAKSSTTVEESQHAPRFQFLLGAFGALGVAAIVLAISLALAPKQKPQPPWSAWKPSGDVDPAMQIAEHVEPEYTLASRKPLVRVAGGPPQFGGQSALIALHSSGSEAVPLGSNGVLYQLCGAELDCSIPGKASAQRGLLVRREALELALYTFHYVSSTTEVVVTYPPLPAGKGTKRSSEEALGSSSSTPHGRALLFRPGDLEVELSHPLEETLANQAPTTSAIEKAPEAHLVDELTTGHAYNFELTTQQGTPILLLQAPVGG